MNKKIAISTVLLIVIIICQSLFYVQLQKKYNDVQTQVISLQSQISDLIDQVNIQYDLGYNAGYIQGTIDGIGRGYNIRDPTYSEAINFIAVNQVDTNTYDLDTYTCWNFASDFKNDAFDTGYRCGLVYISFPDGAHTIVCFDTTNLGIIYIEPQHDRIVTLVVGQPYWDRTIYSPPTYDDTIINFSIAW